MHTPHTAAPLRLRHRVMPLIAAGLLALTVLSGATTATRVSAERVQPGFDSLSIACAGLQNHFRDLVSEYHDASDSRRQAILADARNTNSGWIAAGCQAAYGAIFGVARLEGDATMEGGGIYVSPAVFDHQLQAQAEPTVPVTASSGRFVGQVPVQASR